MNLRRKHRDEAEVSTESLNDIMFFLLLFFLIVSTLANPNVIKLDLPKKGTAAEKPQAPITLEVLGDRMCLLNKHPVSFAGLEAALIAETKNATAPTVVLTIDPQLSVQDLADVLQLGVKTHVKMMLSAQTQALKPPTA